MFGWFRSGQNKHWPSILPWLTTSKIDRLFLREKPGQAINQFVLLSKTLNAKSFHIHIYLVPQHLLHDMFMSEKMVQLIGWSEIIWEGIANKKMRGKERVSRNTNRNVKCNSCWSWWWIRNHMARMTAVKAENLYLAAIILLLFFSRNGHKNHDQWFFSLLLNQG